MDDLRVWVGFNAFVLVMLALDLGVFHRSAHAVSMKEAALWSLAWVALALGFGGGVAHLMGKEAGLEYLAGYLIEKSLSVDNIFVFVLIFSYFHVAPKFQHRILFWGILGALVMRGAMIGLGAYLIHRFAWILYVFGAFLVWTGVRMASHPEPPVDPEANPMLRLVRRVIPMARGDHGVRLIVCERDPDSGRRRVAATPLFVVLVLIETTDVIFAVDSIPAIFAVTQEPFLVYSSNVFAILGLRSLYFLLSGVIDKFRYLKLGLSAVLVFVGLKMLLVDLYKIPTGASLAVIAAIIGASVALSLRASPPADEPEPPPQQESDEAARPPTNSTPSGRRTR